MIRTIFNGLNHYKVSADFNSYRLSPLAPHRVRFAPQNRLLEPADCMMRSEKEIFELLEGIIAEEKSSVACGITIQRMKSEAEPEAIRTAFSLEAAIKSHITELWTVVDVVFDDCLHYDYLQMLAVCEDYVELQKGKPLERMSLVLTLTPLGEYDFFFAGVDGFWAYYTDKATEPCHGLRFIFWKEQFAGYELKPGAVEEMIAGAIDELHFSISANEALNSCLNF